MKKVLFLLAITFFTSNAYAFFGIDWGRKSKNPLYDIQYTVRDEDRIVSKSKLVRLEVPTKGRKVKGADIMESFEKQFVEKHIKNGTIKPGQYKVIYQMNNWGSRTKPDQVRYLEEDEFIPKNMMADVHPIIISM